jgi:hypothetical protein
MPGISGLSDERPPTKFADGAGVAQDPTSDGLGGPQEPISQSSTARFGDSTGAAAAYWISNQRPTGYRSGKTDAGAAAAAVGRDAG